MRIVIIVTVSLVMAFLLGQKHMDTQRITNQNKKRHQILSDKAIKELQEIFLLEKGVSISTDEAQTVGLPFLKFMDKIYRPIPVTNKENKHGK